MESIKINRQNRQTKQDNQQIQDKHYYKDLSDIFQHKRGNHYKEILKQQKQLFDCKSEQHAKRLQQSSVAQILNDNREIFLHYAETQGIDISSPTIIGLFTAENAFLNQQQTQIEMFTQFFVETAVNIIGVIQCELIMNQRILAKCSLFEQTGDEMFLPKDTLQFYLSDESGSIDLELQSAAFKQFNQLKYLNVEQKQSETVWKTFKSEEYSLSEMNVLVDQLPVLVQGKLTQNSSIRVDSVILLPLPPYYYIDQNHSQQNYHQPQNYNIQHNSLAHYFSPSLENDFIAIVSGLHIDNMSDSMPFISSLLHFFTVEQPSQLLQNIALQTHTLIIAGDSILMSPDEHQTLLGAFERIQHYKTLLHHNDEQMSLFEGVVSAIATQRPHDLQIKIMPGAMDGRAPALPQIPFELSSFKGLNALSNVEGVANPFFFSCKANTSSCNINANLAPITVLGTSGQNIKNMQQMQNFGKTTLANMERNVFQHSLDPTNMCREYLNDSSSDFLKIDYLPHVYFSANQRVFDTKIVNEIFDEDNKLCRLVSVPKYSLTQEIVLLNTQTLEVFNISLQNHMVNECF